MLEEALRPVVGMVRGNLGQFLLHNVDDMAHFGSFLVSICYRPIHKPI